jgi:hypothetical protein
MTPEQLTEIVDYIRAHRASDAGPFEVAVEGQTSGTDGEADAKTVRLLANAGLTWWVEKFGWFRGSLEEARVRIGSGPPSLDDVI